MSASIEKLEIMALRRAIDELAGRVDKNNEPPPARVRHDKKTDRLQKMADNFLKYKRRK